MATTVFLHSIAKLAGKPPGSAAIAQRGQQGGQAVVVDFMHQRQQAADLAGRETAARKPGQIMTGQIGNRHALMLAKGHLDGQQAFEIGGRHGGQRESKGRSLPHPFPEPCGRMGVRPITSLPERDMITTPAAPAADPAALELLRRAAQLLLEYNMRSELLQRQLLRLAGALGIACQIRIDYRAVSIFLADGGLLHVQTPELRLNIAVSSEVNRIVEQICAGRLLLAEGLQALTTVEARAERHNRWLLALIFGLGAGALAWLLSGDRVAIATVTLSSALGLLARQELARRHVILFALPFAAALIGSLLGGYVIFLGWTSTPGICLIVPALMLVPGPHLINGLYDVLENHLPTGIARLGLASGLLLAAAMGIFLGGWLTLGMTTVPPHSGPPADISLALDVVLAGIAACSFGAFYNAPWRVLWTSIACGMVGHGLRYLCLAAGMPLEIATLFACIAIGVLASLFVLRLGTPFAAIAFAGAVPMMPGVLIFQGLAGAMQVSFAGQAAALPLVAATFANFFQAAFVVGAMGLGLLLGSRLSEWGSACWRARTAEFTKRA